MKVNDPVLYFLWWFGCLSEKGDAERKAELDKARAKQKKDFKFNFVKPRKDWSIYGGWVNAYEPVNKGRLGSTQEWKIEKLGRNYYWDIE